MACKWQSEVCATEGTVPEFFELVSSILGAASDPRHRRRQYDFSRDGVLSPELLVTMLLFMVGDSNRRGYRHLLDAFWDECASHGLTLPTADPVSAPAFCQARAKISTSLLRDVLHGATSKFAETFRVLRPGEVHGRSLLTAPSSTSHAARSAIYTSAGRQPRIFPRRPSARW